MSEINEVFLKPYDPQKIEGGIYTLWEKSGFFNPDSCVKEGVTKKDAEPFSIVLPPPNVTGALHIGHAYEDSLQDAFVRFARMQGKKTLWIPGTDSAAIATQARVEKDIQKKEGKTRHDLGREELVRRVQEYAKESEKIILSQIRKMGASLDWTRYAYTLDEKRNLAVSTAFKQMYDAGLIYRGNRIVNWDPKGQTTISDDEIVHVPRTATLITFKYAKDFPIPVATTRPETKLGDTGVAVHPEDKRYKEFIGKEYDVTFCGVPLHLKIVGDESVDPEFGTGAVGVTPAHSQTDWEIADRHNLPRPQIIDEYAKMIVDGPLNGKKTVEARKIVVEWLKAEKLFEKEEDIKQNISTSERTGAVIEPLPKLQWWVDVNKEFTIPHSEIPTIESGSTITLKQLMRTAVKSGAVSMPQERFSKIYFHWIDNLRDWCISRQIWYGHQIPVWYHENKCIPIQGREDEVSECEMLVVSLSEPKCQHCNAKYVQDPDVLDTWFSSSLWTFSTLGWPEETEDLKTYHPTTFMSPAYEILPLWVSRMILMSGFHLGQIPFRTVMIHGLVRDRQGRKFSKSLGNGIDPLDMIEKYGADALRMGLLIGTAVGNDISFDEDKVRGYKHFANKIWNIARFVLENTKDADLSKKPELSDADGKRIAELSEIEKDITEHIEDYRLDLSADQIYHYMWHTFADVIIEESKSICSGNDEKLKKSRQWTLYYILIHSLKLLHPFMPFVTEAIWQKLPVKDSDLLMVARWPTPQGGEVGQV